MSEIETTTYAYEPDDCCSVENDNETRVTDEYDSKTQTTIATKEILIGL